MRQVMSVCSIGEHYSNTNLPNDFSVSRSRDGERGRMKRDGNKQWKRKEVERDMVLNIYLINV